MDAQDEQAVPAVMEQLLLQVSANPPHDWYGANLFQPEVPAGLLGADEQFAAPRLLQFGQNSEENLAANEAVVGVQPPPNSPEDHVGGANVLLADDHQGDQEEHVADAQVADAQVADAQPPDAQLADDDQIAQVELPDGDLMEVDEVALAQFADELVSDDEDVIFDRQIQWITIDSDDEEEEEEEEEDEEEDEEEEDEDEEEEEEEDGEDSDATIIVSDDDNSDIADNADEIN